MFSASCKNGRKRERSQLSCGFSLAHFIKREQKGIWPDTLSLVRTLWRAKCERIFLIFCSSRAKGLKGFWKEESAREEAESVESFHFLPSFRYLYRRKEKFQFEPRREICPYHYAEMSPDDSLGPPSERAFLAHPPPIHSRLHFLPQLSRLPFRRQLQLTPKQRRDGGTNRAKVHSTEPHTQHE